MIAVGATWAMPAGATLGQLSTHLPQVLQLSSISLTRSFSAASKLASGIGSLLYVARHYHSLGPNAASGSLLARHRCAACLKAGSLAEARGARAPAVASFVVCPGECRLAPAELDR